MRISDWSSDVCSSDLILEIFTIERGFHKFRMHRVNANMVFGELPGGYLAEHPHRRLRRRIERERRHDRLHRARRGNIDDRSPDTLHRRQHRSKPKEHTAKVTTDDEVDITIGRDHV